MLQCARLIWRTEMQATRTDTVRARISPALKSFVEGIFSSLGMNSSQAIVLFFKQVELHNGLPFEVRIPPKPIPDMATMPDEALDATLQAGLDEQAAGKCIHSATTSAPSRKSGAEPKGAQFDDKPPPTNDNQRLHKKRQAAEASRLNLLALPRLARGTEDATEFCK